LWIKKPKFLNLRTKDSATDERTKQLFLLNIKPKYQRHQVFPTQTVVIWVTTPCAFVYGWLQGGITTQKPQSDYLPPWKS